MARHAAVMPTSLHRKTTQRKIPSTLCSDFRNSLLVVGPPESGHLRLQTPSLIWTCSCVILLKLESGMEPPFDDRKQGHSPPCTRKSCCEPHLPPCLRRALPLCTPAITGFRLFSFPLCVAQALAPRTADERTD